MKLRGDPRFFRGRHPWERTNELPGGGWLLVFVYGFLLVETVSIYLSRTGMWDGSMAIMWLVPHKLGLSLFAIVSSIHLLLFLVLLGSAVLSGWRHRGRLDWVRVGTLLIALVLVLGMRAVANGWKRLAEQSLEYRVAQQEAGEQRIAAIEAELAQLGMHPWAGKYLGVPWVDWTRSKHNGLWAYSWFAPESGLACRTIDSSQLGELHEIERILRIRYVVSELEVAGTLNSPIFDLGRRKLGLQRAVWGERHYLVHENCSAEFKRRARIGDLALHEVPGILLLAADREKPGSGTPSILKGME